MLKVTVEQGVMTVCEIEFRKALIAKNTIAAKRERKAQDKRKSERALFNQRRQD